MRRGVARLSKARGVIETRVLGIDEISGLLTEGFDYSPQLLASRGCRLLRDCI